MTRPVIKRINRPGDSKTGIITGLSVAQINKRLGFKPNYKDDPDKVKYSWGFTVDGERCGVWDYYGSYRNNIFSAWGPAICLEEVFGDHYRSY